MIQLDMQVSLLQCGLIESMPTELFRSSYHNAVSLAGRKKPASAKRIAFTQIDCQVLARDFSDWTEKSLDSQTTQSLAHLQFHGIPGILLCSNRNYTGTLQPKRNVCSA
jgi:hypothetical protein